MIKQLKRDAFGLLDRGAFTDEPSLSLRTPISLYQIEATVCYWNSPPLVA